MRATTKIISGGIEYTKEDLRQMDEVSLRGLLHERVHHGIEVPIYAILLRWKGHPIANFGLQAQAVFEVWRARGLPEDEPDIEWTKRYLTLAEHIRAGEHPVIDEPLPTPFTEAEMAVVHKLLWERRSARGGWLARPVPDTLITQILEAGRAAPSGCNLNEVRFIVLKPPEETRMIWSDISTENAVIIVVCYDKRPSHVVGQDRPTSVPQNRGYDCAAAGDHMLLMVHALGLSGVWLSSTAKTAQQFKDRYGLPAYMEVALHIAFGWPAIGTIKSARVPLAYMLIRSGEGG